MPGLQIGGISLLIHILVNLIAKFWQKFPHIEKTTCYTRIAHGILRRADVVGIQRP